MFSKISVKRTDFELAIATLFSYFDFRMKQTMMDFNVDGRSLYNPSTP